MESQTPELTPAGEVIHEIVEGKFQLMRLLGAGGMAEAWLATDIDLQRTVVIKMPKVSAMNDPITLQRFNREGVNAGQFTHPHIATVHCRGFHGGRPYIAMEYVEGRSLLESLKHGNEFTAFEVSTLLSQIASGLDAAHAKGVIHRDLHLANVMVVMNPDGSTVAKLIDFGISRRVGSESQILTSDKEIVGSNPFIAPELFGGSFNDAQLDVYSLGVIAVALLGNWMPGPRLRGVSLSNVPQSERWDKKMREVLSRALTEDRSLRYVTPGAFAAAFRDVALVSPQNGGVSNIPAPNPGSSILKAKEPAAVTSVQSPDWKQSSSVMDGAAPARANLMPVFAGIAGGVAIFAVLMFAKYQSKASGGQSATTPSTSASTTASKGAGVAATVRTDSAPRDVATKTLTSPSEPQRGKAVAGSSKKENLSSRIPPVSATPPIASRPPASATGRSALDRLEEGMGRLHVMTFQGPLDFPHARSLADSLLTYPELTGDRRATVLEAKAVSIRQLEGIRAFCAFTRDIPIDLRTDLLVPVISARCRE